MAIPTIPDEARAGPAARLSATEPAAAVRLEGVRKRYGDVVAVAGIDLEIRDGEFFSMLGPSGSGKTTTLRMIAGFELPTAGPILLDGQDVPQRPPFERDVNTVFQDYALFPHMTVGRQRGLRPDDPQGAAGRARRGASPRRSRMVRLEGYEERKPGQLSGGQRQRVALARALVNRPRCCSSTSRSARSTSSSARRCRSSSRRSSSEVGITFIYVTHDQEEALTMSDRIAIFNRGRIEQVGTPADVYERPRRAFVAGFVGTSNLLRGDVAEARHRAARHVHRAAREDPPRGARATRRRRRDAAHRTHPRASSTSAPTPATTSRSTPAVSSSSSSRTSRRPRWRRSRAGQRCPARLEAAAHARRSRLTGGRSNGGGDG